MRISHVAACVSLLSVFVLPSVPVSGQAPNLPARPRVFVDTSYRPPTGGAVFEPADSAALRTALSAAKLGDRIVLRAGTVYEGPFSLPPKSGSGWIYLESSDLASLPPPGSRVGPADAAHMPKIVSPSADPALRTSGAAHHYRVVGVELGVEPSVSLNYGVVAFGDVGENQNSLDEVPHDLVVDRCYIHGNATSAVSRGVALNSASSAVIDSYISEMHSESADTQAVMGWNGPGPFKIVDNYLEGAGENVMFGGGDPSIPNLVPSDIEVRRNHFAKPLSWRVDDPTYAGKHWSVKNLFELKNARRVLVDGNLFEYCWGDAQTGFAIVFTPRNQDNTAPWCSVEDVTFTDNVVRHAASGVNVLGRDDINASQPLARVLVRNNLFDDISGTRWNGYGRFAQLLNGTTDVVIDHNTVIQTGPVIFAEGPSSSGFIFTNNVARHNDYGVVGTGTASGTGTLTRYFAGCLFKSNVLAGGQASVYPPSNFFPASIDEVGFVDAAGGDYRLSPTSRYLGAGTNGSNLGPDFDALGAAIEGLTIRRVDAVDAATDEFRLKVTGTNFQPDVEIFVGESESPWPDVRFKSPTSLVLTNAKELRHQFARGTNVAVRLLNPNGDESTMYFAR